MNEPTSKQNRLRIGVAAISEKLGTGARTTYRLLQDGEIPARKVGGQWASTDEALERYMAEFAQ